MDNQNGNNQKTNPPQGNHPAPSSPQSLPTLKAGEQTQAIAQESEPIGNTVGGKGSALPPVPPTPQPQNATYSPQFSPTPPVPGGPNFNQNTQAPNFQSPPPPPPPNLGGSSSGAKLFLAVFLLLFGIIGLLLTGGVAMAYNDYKVVSLPKPLQTFFDTVVTVAPLPKTERLVMERMQFAMAGAKSATVENIFELKTDNASFPIKDATLNIKGPIDMKSANINKSQFDISASVKTEGVQLSGAGSIVQVGNTIYFKVTEIPGGSFGGFDQLKNQWYFIDTSKLEGSQPGDSQKVQEFISKVKEIYAKYLGQSQDWSTLSTANSSDYVVSLKPPKNTINNFIYDVIEAGNEIDGSQSLDQSIQKENLKKFTDSIQNFQITLNISKSTYRIDKLETNMDLKIDNAQAANFNTGQVSLSPSNSMTFNLDYTANFTDYDKQILIEPPQNALDFQKIMDDYTKTYMNQLQQNQSLDLNQEQFTPPPQNQQPVTTYVYWVHTPNVVDSPGTAPNPTQATSNLSHTFAGLTPGKTYSGVICSPDCNTKVVWTQNVTANPAGSITLVAPSPAASPSPSPQPSTPSASPAPQNQSFNDLLEPSPVLGQKQVPWDLFILHALKSI